MEIGTPDDTTAVKLMIEIGGSLFVVKERGIYQVKLADEIDPGRSNANIPNVQQRVIPYGTSNDIVARTLLTAGQLPKSSYLDQSIDHKQERPGGDGSNAPEPR
jgi:hypothetical protein